MSTRQIQRSISDVLALDPNTAQDWSNGYMKKLLSATSTLYNTSLNKVFLKQDEETARCHICAYIATEKLATKYMADLQYYMDRIPLEPKKVRNLLDVFKQNMFQMSPVKNIQWTPSPKKRSPLKNSERFTSKDPKELRQQLFGTPSKGGSASKLSSPEKLASETPNTSPMKTRRKLTFEEDSDGEDDSITTGNIGSLTGTVDHVNKAKRTNEDDERDSGSLEPKKKQARERRKTASSTPIPMLSNNNLLTKKNAKISVKDIIDICNQFELPKEVAYCILDEYQANSTYLSCRWQLVCGLVLNCEFVVYNEKRRKDPRINHLLLEKMVYLMNARDITEVTDCMKIVKEIIIGEKWFRNLQIEYNNFEGAKYEEVISSQLGSMLQPNNILVTGEQFSNWKYRLEQDLALRFSK